jgi:hypothetical protein
MAQGVVTIPATGTGDATPDVAVDDCTTDGKAQIVKLGVSTDGSVTRIPADADGLRVQQPTANKMNVTEASAADIKTAVQLLDDAVKADDAAFAPATDKVLMVGAECDDAAPDSVDEGDAGALRMSARRELYTQIRDAAGNERGADVTAANALKTDGSAVTQPVSAAALPLPTGAATETTLGAVKTAAELIDDAVATTGAAVPAKGMQATGTDGTNARALKTDADGELQVDVLTVPADPFGANADAASATGSISAKLRFIAGTGIPITGTVTVGTHAVTQSGTWTVTVGTGATDLGKAEDAAHTSGDVGVMMLGVRAAAPTDRSAGPTDGDYEPVGINEVGAAWVTPTPSANGGASTMNATSGDGSTALTNAAQVIKASAGTLLGWSIYNPNTVAVFVQFYNTAAAGVTVGTTAPLFVHSIPPGSTSNMPHPFGVAFSTAMSWAAVMTSAAGNTAPTTALDAVCWYK